jgi:hypothetical protein
MNEARTDSPKSKADAMALVEEAEADAAEAHALAAALSELRPDSAVVLRFVDPR